jgi:cytochrome P450
VAWALYELSEHPDIQVRLRSEIHSVLGKHYDPENPPTQSQLDRMTYLNNVCREVLRIDPPGAFPTIIRTNMYVVPLTGRQAVDDDVYEGVHIPKDTMIHFPALVINMSHEIWGPNAEEFRPERWESLKDVPNTHFLTFQHGKVHSDND